MTKTLLATGLSFLLATTSLSATEVKIAMNGVNDPATNAEAAFAAGFSEALEGTGFDVNIFPSDTLGSERERFDQVAQGASGNQSGDRIHHLWHESHGPRRGAALHVRRWR